MTKGWFAFLVFGLSGLILLSGPALLQAQVSGTGVLGGTVYDPTGAVIPGAKVELRDTATNVVRTTETNAVGQYVLPNVAPGVYRVTVTAPGFRSSVVGEFKVDVGKTYSLNFNLEVGAMAEVVEVTAGAYVELQTANSSVGAVLGGEHLQRLPTLDRSAASLLLLQPLVNQGGDNTGATTGGQVAGSRSDQNTFMIDGADATNDTEAGGGYAYGAHTGNPLPVIPVPVESIEEFRVTAAQPTADFGRAAGGEVQMVTKRGTNKIHGSAYWYHQNDNLNANTWDLNAAGQPIPESKENRYGFSAGGPIWKDWTWLYGHFEGYRFPQSATITRTVPTSSLRQGILTFRDATGVARQYNLATSTACGPAGGLPCDPRGLGMSTLVQSYFNLFPAVNDETWGDDLNSNGFRGTAQTPEERDFFVARFDQKISDRWSLFSSYRYFHRTQPDANQIDLAGGNPVAVANAPISPRFFVVGVDGQITSHLTAQARFGYARNWWEWQRSSPSPQVSGLNGALDVAGDDICTSGRYGTACELSEPINIDTQNARSRIWNGKDRFYGGSFSWLVGSHTISWGGTYRRWDIFHRRNDKVTGAVDSLIFFSDVGSNFQVTADYRPPTCGGAVTTNCLQAADVARWNRLYAVVLGIVDRQSILGTRTYDPTTGLFTANPVGTPLDADVTVDAYEFYAADTWRVRPSFTVTYGLSYNLQLPPTEKDGKQMLLVYYDDNVPVDAHDYFFRRQQAALRGEIFNPELGWSPVDATGRKYPFEVDWNNFGPRASAAWQPNYDNWFFGGNKTVFRGGYSVTFDRVNGVGIVMTPLLGVGLGQIMLCNGPNRLTGTCAGTTNALTAYRVGVDGAGLAMPALGPATAPIAVASPFGETSARGADVGRKVGENHTLSFTIQRELPGDMILEVGYVGKFGRKLSHNVDMNAVPWFMVSSGPSGQTIAAAFDGVADQLRAGVTAANVTPQGFWEEMLNPAAIGARLGLPGITSCAQVDVSLPTPGIQGGSCTAGLAQLFSSNFINNQLAGLFVDGIDRRGMSFDPFGFVNVQSRVNQLVTDAGKTNYNAGFASLRKRMSHGLLFEANYTWSKAMGSGGLNQQYVNGILNFFDPNLAYAPEVFDRTHTFVGHWLYELPFGRGRRWSTGNWGDKVIGGWSVSGYFSAYSGLPLCVNDGGDWGGIFDYIPTCAYATGSVPKSGKVHRDPTTGELNAFADPDAVFDAFRRVSFSRDPGSHGMGQMRGLARWDLSTAVYKTTKVTETVSITFNFDFTNILNHVDFNDPSTSLVSPASFGVLGSQFNLPRQIQFGFRVDF